MSQREGATYPELMSKEDVTLRRCEDRIADMERRVAEQRLRLPHEGSVAFGAAEVHALMLETLTHWRDHKTEFQRRFV